MQINDWLESSCTVPSASPYDHPVLFAENKGLGGLRLCVNYYSLNANMVTNALPLSCIDDLISGLKGARVFSSLDLWDSYYQISVDPSDRFKMAFACHYR